MSPEEQSMGQWDLLSSCQNQIDHVLEVALACLHMPWVNICKLELGKIVLHWTSIVRMWSCETDGYFKLLVQFQTRLACLIGGVVEQDHRASSPVLLLLVHFLHKVMEE